MELNFVKWLDKEKPEWNLREDAPPEIVKQFEEYKKRDERAKKKNIVID